MTKTKPRNSINSDYAENKRIKTVKLQLGISFLYNLSEEIAIKVFTREKNRDEKVLQKDSKMFCEGSADKHTSHVYRCISYV